MGHGQCRLPPAGEVSDPCLRSKLTLVVGVLMPSQLAMNLSYCRLHCCSGHDCSVYMLMFMDILAMKADGLYFGSPYVHHAHDKLLMSYLQGSAAHFPGAFLEGT